MEFCNDNSIEEKMYPSDFVINSLNKRPVILIIHNKSTFLANNSQYQTWIKKSDIFLQPKERGKDIIVSDFLIP